MRKLGLIAGGGDLPIRLAERCRTAGRPLFVIRLRDIADPALAAFPGEEAGLAELGRVISALRRSGCEAVCFAGQVKRPDLSALKPDLRGLKSLPAAIAAAGKGDDALLRFLVREFEAEGFIVEGADQVDHDLTLPAGPLGRHAPSPEHQDDIARAVQVAKLLGSEDIGQAVAVAGGLVLAVEAQEGTDAMLARCADLPAPLRGTSEARKGVLVKWPKPIQERRVDLPTLGAATVRGAAAAGLAGIVGEARGMLVIDRDAVAEAADALGLFVIGLA
jgi:DUF1009 family protein